jgi:hypothetical protein
MPRRGAPSAVGIGRGGRAAATLRGLAARAPYFHNGVASTLEQVVEFYDARFSMGLSKEQKEQLSAFWARCSSRTSEPTPLILDRLPARSRSRSEEGGGGVRWPMPATPIAAWPRRLKPDAEMAQARGGQPGGAR